MSTLTTTVKVDVCSFSEYRMYPGRGTKFASRDGKVYFFLNSKISAFGHKKIKPVKLRWTQGWRRANKKVQSSNAQRRRTKRIAKHQKAIVGLTLEDLISKRIPHQKISSKAIKNAKDKVRNAKAQLAAPITSQPKQTKQSAKVENKPSSAAKTLQIKHDEQPKAAPVESKPSKQTKKQDAEKSKLVQEPAPPKKEEKPAPPKKEEKPAPPKKEEKPVPPKEDKAEMPKNDDKPEEPKKSGFIGKLFGRKK